MIVWSSKLIRDVLKTRPEIDYFKISFSKFCNMNFRHPHFKGTGKQLLAKYWWGENQRFNKSDYMIFIQDIIGWSDTWIEESGKILGKLVDQKDNFDEMTKSEVKECVRIVISTLPVLEREILSLSFGVNELWEVKSDCQIAKKCRLTTERVRVIRYGAIRRIRGTCRIDLLVGLL